MRTFRPLGLSSMMRFECVPRCWAEDGMGEGRTAEQMALLYHILSDASNGWLSCHLFPESACKYLNEIQLRFGPLDDTRIRKIHQLLPSISFVLTLSYNKVYFNVRKLDVSINLSHRKRELF